MTRTLLIAASLTILASSTQADQILDRFRWDGSMHVTGQSEDCGGLFFSSDNERASFYPKLDEDYPSSSFTRMRDGVAELIQKDSNSGQFDGTGYYISYTIAGGGFTRVPDPNDEGSDQTYSFTQTPATVAADTVFVTLTGTLDNYRGIYGCSVTLTGTFVRADPPPIN